jgi:asparagine synthase (glutamine-hydrolysing)
MFDLRRQAGANAGAVEGSGIDRARLVAMNESQHHRGPVEGDVHIEAGLGFGHRRLSVIDLACGLQPLFSEDGNVVIVFNGEIYNFLELREELQQLGHRFRTRSDTEVIVYAWIEWGAQCVSRLRGMFAFAIWDRRAQTLFLARDRLGIKPMYCAYLPGGLFLFGSELKSLMTVPELSREIDPCAVEDYFAYGYVPEPKTIFTSAFKLMPGHTLTLVPGGKPARQEQYWDLSFDRVAPMSEAEAVEELRVQLGDAVKSHLVADVPLGAFLSGGVDSSAVVATMAGLRADGDKPVSTCSIAFNDPAYDESTYATEVARQYGTDHYSETVEADDYGLIDTLAALYDEPYADSSAIPTYRVCELARKRVTVALSGDGGDENFAGYRRYRYAMAEQKVRSLLPSGLRKPVFGFLGNVYPKADWAPQVLRAKTTFEALSRDLVEGYFHGVSKMPDRMRKQLFSKAFSAKLQGYRAIEVMQAHAGAFKSDDPLSMLQYLDMKTWLPGDILTKVDRASMAHALEVRVPLLDHQFVEWAASVPSALKLKGQEGKYLFKKSLEPLLSDDILYRRKMGFSIPLARWLRGPLRERLQTAVLGGSLAETGIFDMAFLRELVEQHLSGRRDNADFLWTVLMFEAFLRNLTGVPFESRAAVSA